MSQDAREQARHKAAVMEWENLGPNDIIRKGDEVSHFGSDEWIPAVGSIGRKFSAIDAESRPFKARRCVKTEERKPREFHLWLDSDGKRLWNQGNQPSGCMPIKVVEVLPETETE